MPKTQFSPSFLVQCKRTLILSNSSQNRKYVSKQDKILSTEIWDNIGLWKVNQQYETSYPVDVKLVNLIKIANIFLNFEKGNKLKINILTESQNY